jgi:FkbM family methyltransferase
MQFRIMDNKRKKLYNYIKKISRNISVLDVGARDGLGWPWNELNKNFVDSILVEPDPIEAKKIQNKLIKSENSVVLPVAFWNNRNSMKLNLNKSPGTSSIFSSNFSFLNQFPDSDRFKTMKKINIECTTIDYLLENNKMPSFDFAKIDIQGGELAVLEGGINHIKSNVVGLEVEVEFVELYNNQPLFGEIDTFIRTNLGLELWDLSKAHWKYSNKLNFGPNKGRIIFGNALYLRPLNGLKEWLAKFPNKLAIEKLLMLISTSLAYGYLDYVYAILNHKVCSKYIENEVRLEILKNLNSMSNGFRPFKNGNNILHKIFNILASVFKDSNNGRISEGKLGSHKKGPFWF